MPIALESSAYPSTAYPSASHSAAPLLRGMPSLLEYRAEADPDAEFIPKTIAGFAGGFMLFGACLVIATLMYKYSQHPAADFGKTVATYLAFLIGIDGVASSLLLVGLKVRADHAPHYLFARHWLNSIGTGALYAFMIAGPWALFDRGFLINRFVAAGVFMVVMAFPAIAAKWTVGPQAQLARPGE